MKSVPRFLRGPFRDQERGWKLFLMIPRMLLHRGPGGGGIPRNKLIARFEAFARGEWLQLVRQ